MTDELEKLLENALKKACLAQNATVITSARSEILNMPREATVNSIERVASRCLSLDDEWQFRRLLELYAQLNLNLLQRLVQEGQMSSNSEIREAAQDFTP